MLEILNAGVDLVVGLVGYLAGILGLVAGFAWDILYHLHVDAPRLEGLIVGIALAWLLARRDKHPLLRMLSAPLKLILDILDLAWDQVVEVVADGWGVVRDWTLGSLGWCRDRVAGVWNRGLGLLRAARDKLSRSE